MNLESDQGNHNDNESTQDHSISYIISLYALSSAIRNSRARIFKSTDITLEHYFVDICSYILSLCLQIHVFAD